MLMARSSIPVGLANIILNEKSYLDMLATRSASYFHYTAFVSLALNNT